MYTTILIDEFQLATKVDKSSHHFIQIVDVAYVTIVHCLCNQYSILIGGKGAEFKGDTCAFKSDHLGGNYIIGKITFLVNDYDLHE